MKKIIGNKNIFAIQYEFSQVEVNLVYGYICYWIKGIQVGDFLKLTILNDSLIFLPRIIKDKGNREHKKFFDMDKKNVCYFLGGQAYWDSDEYEEIAMEEMWARFNIKIGLDVFNNAIIKLIDGQDVSRIVFSYNDIVNELYLEKGVVDDVILSFYEELMDFGEVKK